MKKSGNVLNTMKRFSFLTFVAWNFLSAHAFGQDANQGREEEEQVEEKVKDTPPNKTSGSINLGGAYQTDVGLSPAFGVQLNSRMAQLGGTLLANVPKDKMGGAIRADFNFGSENGNFRWPMGNVLTIDNSGTTYSGYAGPGGRVFSNNICDLTLAVVGNVRVSSKDNKEKLNKGVVGGGGAALVGRCVLVDGKLVFEANGMSTFVSSSKDKDQNTSVGMSGAGSLKYTVIDGKRASVGVGALGQFNVGYKSGLPDMWFAGGHALVGFGAKKDPRVAEESRDLASTDSAEEVEAQEEPRAPSRATEAVSAFD